MGWAWAERAGNRGFRGAGSGGLSGVVGKGTLTLERETEDEAGGKGTTTLQLKILRKNL